MRSLVIGGMLGAVVFLLLYTHTIGNMPLEHYPAAKLLTYAATLIATGALAVWVLAWFANRN